MVELRAAGREQVADWIETSLLVRGGRQLGMDSLLELANEEVGAGPAAVSLAMTVMKRRATMLGEAYPFDVNDIAVRARLGAAGTAYAALLLLTPEGPARQLLHPAPTTGMAVLFERITSSAAVAMMGSQARALRFGWPSDQGRPQEFGQAIEWLAKQMGIRPGAAYRPPRRRDGGIDVVAWRPFPDGRSGFPVMLVQCTLQADIRAKAGDIDTRFWGGWLTLDSDPLTALAVPQTIPAGVVWDELAVRSLILERVRLAGLVTELVSGAAEFAAEEVDNLSGTLAAGAT